MTTVALADDHNLLCAILSSFVNKMEGFRVLYTAHNGMELIAHIQQFGPPDIAIIDLDMPVMNGYQAAMWIKNNHPATKILMLGETHSDVVLVHLLRAGVHGLVGKWVSLNECERAMLHLVNSDSYYLSNEDAARVMEYMDTGMKLQKNVLLDEELVLIKLLHAGKTHSDMAVQIGVTTRTIHNMLDAMCRKLHLKGSMSLLVHAINTGIIHL